VKPLWTSDELAQATGAEPAGEFTCSGVAFDSREIGSGDLFFALKGEESDGHLFVDQAFGNGAAAAIVSEPVGHNHLLVDDTMAALNAVATASRSRTNAKIIGVTGSAGKTGTKEALYAALDRASRGHAHRSVKSYNNHVGVPLSLARMPQSSEYAVLEMGMNHPGELRALTALVRPDVAIITTIAPAHIGFFKDEHEIALAKAEIFEGLMPGGTAIIPADNPHYAALRSAAEKYAGKIVSFGFDPRADVRATDYVASPCGGHLVTARLPSGSICYTLSQPGKHWIANSLAVLAAVEAVGADLASAGLALAELGGLPGRGARHRVSVGGGEVVLIDESYNANPASMAATISELGRAAPGRKVTVLGAMKELGALSDHYHAELAGQMAGAGVDYAILVGKEMQILVEKLNQGVEGPRQFDHCDDAGEAAVLLQQYLRADDTVLVKGSNSMGLSAIIAAMLRGNN
jgi:UDP-N-acetylmuramoyl-tripeptide--D-alanyl-D-alanine ligase